MSKTIYIINQFGNAAKCTEDTWRSVQDTQPNAKIITAEEFTQLTGEEAQETIEVEVTTETIQEEVQNLTTEEEVKTTLDLSAYTKDQLIVILQALDAETQLTVKNTEAKIITAIQQFSDEQITAVLPKE
jgi:hypothetical protein